MYPAWKASLNAFKYSSRYELSGMLRVIADCNSGSMLRLYCDVVLVMRASWLTPSFVVQRAS